MNRRLFLLILFFLAAYLGLTLAFQPQIKKVLRIPVSPAAVPTVTKVSEKITYECQTNRTVFDLLKEGVNNVEVKEYSFGKLVTGIGGLEGGTAGKYWNYFIDDQAASVSADNYKCQDKEKIEWRFGKAG